MKGGHQGCCLDGSPIWESYTETQHALIIFETVVVYSITDFAYGLINSALLYTMQRRNSAEFCLLCFLGDRSCIYLRPVMEPSVVNWGRVLNLNWN